MTARPPLLRRAVRFEPTTDGGPVLGYIMSDSPREPILAVTKISRATDAEARSLIERMAAGANLMMRAGRGAAKAGGYCGEHRHLVPQILEFSAAGMTASAIAERLSDLKPSAVRYILAVERDRERDGR